MRVIKVQYDDFELARHYDDLRAQCGEAVGAIASFVGLVRDHNLAAGDGGTVATLSLEHYPGMTESSIEAIVVDAQQRWPLLGVTVVHRVGELQPMEQIVLVLVASAHRDAAFAAAEFVMDYLKTRAVFWKKEVSDQGERWIESTLVDQDRARTWNAADQASDH
ncbi:MAG: molybdenum cofactor biosynthesis protein MoaE [Proteobacteria bacterium]|nr:molybdenum cofactor biosynthesis protein MoaE [Pseudomonadota bacterium]